MIQTIKNSSLIYFLFEDFVGLLFPSFFLQGQIIFFALLEKVGELILLTYSVTFEKILSISNFPCNISMEKKFYYKLISPLSHFTVAFSFEL